MSNMIFNGFGKIKFIDMRGRVGKELNMFGDIAYDYAQVLQSLISYDEVLTDKRVNESYRDNLLQCFWECKSQNAPALRDNDIKLICRSLLFSLIPLHNGQGECDRSKAFFGLMSQG